MDGMPGQRGLVGPPGIAGAKGEAGLGGQPGLTGKPGVVGLPVQGQFAPYHQPPYHQVSSDGLGGIKHQKS